MRPFVPALLAVSTSGFAVLSCGSFGAEPGREPAVTTTADDAGEATTIQDADAADVAAVVPEQKCRGESFAPPARVNQTTFSALKSIRLSPSGTFAWLTGTPNDGSATTSIAKSPFDVSTADVGSPTAIIGNGDFDSAQGMSTPDDKHVVFHSTRPSSAPSQTRRLWFAKSGAAVAEPVEIDYAPGVDLQDPYVVGSHIYFVEGGKIRFGDLIATDVTPRIENARDALAVQSVDHPVVSADELELFYTTSDGALHRTARVQPAGFVDGPALSGQNAVGKPSYLAPDGCVLYFSTGNLLFRSARL